MLSTAILSAQSDKASKVARYLETFSFPVTDNEGKKSIVKYNSEVKALTIDGYRLLLKNLNLFIEYTENYYLVSFRCKSEENCIKDPDGDFHIEFSVPFANRKRCEDFISIINAL